MLSLCWEQARSRQHGLFTRQAVAQCAIIVRETSTFKAHMACLLGKLWHNMLSLCGKQAHSRHTWLVYKASCCTMWGIFVSQQPIHQQTWLGLSTLWGFYKARGLISRQLGLGRPNSCLDTFETSHLMCHHNPLLGTGVAQAPGLPYIYILSKKLSFRNKH